MFVFTTNDIFVSNLERGFLVIHHESQNTLVLIIAKTYIREEPVRCRCQYVRPANVLYNLAWGEFHVPLKYGTILRFLSLQLKRVGDLRKNRQTLHSLLQVICDLCDFTLGCINVYDGITVLGKLTSVIGDSTDSQYEVRVFLVAVAYYRRLGKQGKLALRVIDARLYISQSVLFH